mgnify:CR=1 FL=1
MTDRINRAFLFALYAHGEQRRKDGLPYIVHPFEVGMTLARNGADEALVCAGLLHDTIEDAYITPEQLRAAFDEEVAELVLEDSEDKTKNWEERRLSDRCTPEATVIGCSCAPTSWPTSAVSATGWRRREMLCGTALAAARTSRRGCSARRRRPSHRWKDCPCMRS